MLSRPGPQSDQLEPGDRPGRRLARAPSERYAAGSAIAPRQAGRAGSARTAIGRATGAAVVTALALALLGGVLAAFTGLLAVAGLGGAVIGLLTAGAAVSVDGASAPALGRGRAGRLAVALAVGAVVAGAALIWVYSLVEGGVLGPIDYLWTTFGPYIPAEAVIAAIGAAWGAGAGPVRWRDG